MLVTKLYKTPEAIVAACLAARALAPSTFPPDLPPDPVTGVAAWYSFERTAWGIGEVIRQSLQENPKLKKDPDVIRAILGVVQDRNLRRGRESFVMLLGFTGAAKHAPLLASFTSDSDINGHVVDTLLKMRASGYAAQVAQLTNHNRAWIRRLAQRYVGRYPNAA